jgi:HlyD family secretion protein
VSQKENVLVIPNMAMRFRPPDQKDEAQELLRQERARVAAPVGTRRTSRAGGIGGGGGARGNRRVTIYVLKDNKAQPLEVQIGITDGTRSEVLGEVLNENDPVIIGMSSAAAPAGQSGVANPFQPQPARGPGLGGFR